MEIYDAQWAADYERMAEAAIPGRAGLYRLCGAALGQLPTPSRILVVGSGTGAELLALAAALPDATFVALEPAAAMRAACAERIAAAGLGRRIEMLGTTLAAFACADQFDAATSVLVSQHCAGDDEAAAFFRRLSDLLTDGGRLYTADLHVALGQDRDAMLALWVAQAASAGIAREVLDGMLARFAVDVRVRDEATLLGFLAGAGFVDVLKPFSSVIYGAWTARKAPAA